MVRLARFHVCAAPLERWQKLGSHGYQGSRAGVAVLRKIQDLLRQLPYLARGLEAPGLLLDEPSEGIQPTIVQALGQLLRAIVAERRCGLLLVEQNRRLAMSVAQRGYLMDRQTIVEEGDMQRLEQEGIIRRHMAF